MSNEEHYRKLEKMYLSAPVNAYYQPTIKVQEMAAEISIDVKKEYFHAGHALHGAVYFKMLDDAAFFAANSKVTDSFVVTTTFTIQLYRPVNQGRIISKGKLLFSSTNLFSAESKLYTEDGVLVASGTGSFMKSHLKLSSEIGYTLG